jgi:hypothetical protein
MLLVFLVLQVRKLAKGVELMICDCSASATNNPFCALSCAAA